MRNIGWRICIGYPVFRLCNLHLQALHFLNQAEVKQLQPTVTSAPASHVDEQNHHLPLSMSFYGYSSTWGQFAAHSQGGVLVGIPVEGLPFFHPLLMTSMTESREILQFGPSCLWNHLGGLIGARPCWPGSMIIVMLESAMVPENGSSLMESCP